MITSIFKKIQNKFFKSLIYLSLFAYLSLIVAVSLNYNALIMHPVKAWYAGELMVVDFLNGGSKIAPEITKGSLSANLTSLDSAAVLSEKTLYSDQGLAAKLPEVEEAYLDKAASLPKKLPAKVSMESYDLFSTVNQIEEQTLADVNLFADLSTGSEIAPSQEQVNELLTKKGRTQTTQNIIPETVLTRVQESTGIDPAEIKELLERD